MGHSFQVISILAKSKLASVFAVPVLPRLCEGVIFNAKRKTSLLEKLVDMVFEITKSLPAKTILVADAYYASQKVIVPLINDGHHLVSRMRSNGSAYRAAPRNKRKGAGRPKMYGKQVKLKNLFKASNMFHKIMSPVYGESNIEIQIRHIDLLWKPTGKITRFVLVKHPVRGSITLLSTSTKLDPIEVVRLYGLRFKIEVSFKQIIHNLGGYCYHFWMKDMKKIKKFSKGQNITRKDLEYKHKVERKLNAYQNYVFAGCVAQGLLQHLSLKMPEVVWGSFGSWMRTMNRNGAPSEMVVAIALKDSFFQFLLETKNELNLMKFMSERIGAFVPSNRQRA